MNAKPTDPLKNLRATPCTAPSEVCLQPFYLGIGQASERIFVELHRFDVVVLPQLRAVADMRGTSRIRRSGFKAKGQTSTRS